MGRDIVTRLSESIGADFSNVADAIENMEQVDLGELDNQGLLEVIAEAARVVAKSSSASARTEVDQLVELTSMREAVEPNYSVVLSGTNSIDIANNPQPVVPDSDNKEYNIRNLYMRSFPTNSKNIFVGDDRVAPSSGFMLRPGEWFRVGLDFRETELYMASEEQGAEVGLMGLF